ncbi:MAG TPA: hypothetical protein VF624_17740, partial [Tepidisphaeraceae bacterium]
NIVVQLNQLFTNVLGVLAKGGAKIGAIGGLGDIYGFLVGGPDLIAQLKFQLLRDVVKNLIGAEETYQQTRSNYAVSVGKAFFHLKKYYRCLAVAEKECDGTLDDPDFPEDAVRSVPVRVSSDPNDILGPDGFGPQKFVRADLPLDYVIRFENEPTATAPAQVVKITQALDADLDARTFRLGDFGFGGEFFDVPEGSSFYQTRLDLRQSHGIYLDVVAGVDVAGGQVFWQFISIDPATGDVPTNPDLGFLPVNTASPQGEGFVQYTILPKTGSATGTRVDALATIVFDKNAPIETPAIFNTLDNVAPTSVIDPLPGVSAKDFAVVWRGDDDANGSAISAFDVYVSTNGGAYELWLGRTNLSSGVYTGQTGSTYAFYAVAVDNAGNVEAAPSVADATTTVGNGVNNLPTLTLDLAPAVIDEGGVFARLGTAADPDAGDTLTAEVDYGAGAGFVALELGADGSFALANTYADNGVYTVTVRVTDARLGVTQGQIGVTVNNVAPVIADIADVVLAWDGSGATLGSSGAFADPGADTFTGEVDFGSGFVPLALGLGKTFSLSNRFTTPGLYAVTVKITDDDNGVGTKSFNVRVLPPKPAVSNIVVNDGLNPQRSMVRSLQVTFDSAVAALPATAVSLLLRTPGGPQAVSATLATAMAGESGRVWKITWTGTGVEAGSLADGVYDVTIDTTYALDPFGQAGTTASQVTFHRLFGDRDGDRDTDGLDVAYLRQIQGKPAYYVWHFDADSDGDIDNADYLAARMRTTKKLFA